MDAAIFVCKWECKAVQGIFTYYNPRTKQGDNFVDKLVNAIVGHYALLIYLFDVCCLSQAFWIRTNI